MKKSKKVLLILLVMMFIPGLVYAAPEDDLITSDVISPAPDVNVIPGDTIDDNVTDGDILTPDANIISDDTVTTDPIVDSVDTITDTTGTDKKVTTTDVKTTVVSNPVETKEENNDILYMSILGGIVVVTIIAVVALYKKSEQA